MHQRSFHRSLNHLASFSVSVVVQDVDVEFSLMGQARECQVAASQIADDRVDLVGPEEQIELRVQWVTEEQLYDQLSRFELRGQPPQPGFVFIRRDTENELIAKFFREFLFQSERSLIVDRLIGVNEAQALAELFCREPLHPNEQATSRVFLARPSLDVRPISSSHAD